MYISIGCYYNPNVVCNHSGKNRKSVSQSSCLVLRPLPFAFWTNRFFERVFQSGAILLYSDVIDDELVAAPDDVIRFVKSIPDSRLQNINLNEEAVALAEKYIAENVVGPSSMADCYNPKTDLLVSWNFKHIVNIKRIHDYNAVNLKNGFHTLEIRNPREAFDYENNN